MDHFSYFEFSCKKKEKQQQQKVKTSWRVCWRSTSFLETWKVYIHRHRIIINIGFESVYYTDNTGFLSSILWRHYDCTRIQQRSRCLRYEFRQKVRRLLSNSGGREAINWLSLSLHILLAGLDLYGTSCWESIILWSSLSLSCIFLIDLLFLGENFFNEMSRCCSGFARR